MGNVRYAESPNTSILAGYKKARNFAEQAYIDNYFIDVVDGERIKGRPRFEHSVDVAEEIERFIKHNESKGGKKYNERRLIHLGYFHDLFEDTTVSRSMVAYHFGKDIADGVSAMTKDKRLPKKEQMEDSLRRILTQSPEVAIAKMCDRICNLRRTKKVFSEEKRKEYAEESILIARMLGRVNYDVYMRLVSAIRWYRNDKKVTFNQ